MAIADLMPSFNLVRLKKLCILNSLWVVIKRLVIIQHIVTLPKYGHGALNIPRP